MGAKSKGRGLGVKRSDITRAKISNALKGKTKTPEHVAKIVANRIYVISDETREKHRILSTGRKQSDAAKLKKSIALKGRKQPTQNCPYCNKSIGGKTNFSKHTRICQEKLIHQ